jgi:hypothetical protein
VAAMVLLWQQAMTKTEETFSGDNESHLSSALWIQCADNLCIKKSSLMDCRIWGFAGSQLPGGNCKN